MCSTLLTVLFNSVKPDAGMPVVVKNVSGILHVLYADIYYQPVLMLALRLRDAT